MSVKSREQKVVEGTGSTCNTNCLYSLMDESTDELATEVLQI